jgi:hypothetical protein
LKNAQNEIRCLHSLVDVSTMRCLGLEGSEGREKSALYRARL